MAWELLLNSDFGLMSLGVILGVIIIAAGLIVMFNDKIKRSEQKRLERHK